MRWGRGTGAAWGGREGWGARLPLSSLLCLTPDRPCHHPPFHPPAALLAHPARDRGQGAGGVRGARGGGRAQAHRARQAGGQDPRLCARLVSGRACSAVPKGLCAVWGAAKNRTSWGARCAWRIGPRHAAERGARPSLPLPLSLQHPAPPRAARVLSTPLQPRPAWRRPPTRASLAAAAAAAATVLSFICCDDRSASMHGAPGPAHPLSTPALLPLWRRRPRVPFSAPRRRADPPPLGSSPSPMTPDSSPLLDTRSCLLACMLSSPLGRAPVNACRQRARAGSQTRVGCFHSHRSRSGVLQGPEPPAGRSGCASGGLGCVPATRRGRLPRADKARPRTAAPRLGRRHLPGAVAALTLAQVLCGPPSLAVAFVEAPPPLYCVLFFTRDC